MMADSKPMTRRQALSAAGAAAVAPTFGRGPEGAAKRPNVVLILADDLGWMDTATYGSRFYDTPNLTRLARRGMLFHNAYAANPLCSPTRASILTGLYPARLRLTTPAGHVRDVVLDPKLPATGPPAHRAVQPDTRTRLPLDCFTLAEALRDAGYDTAHFGKWHLGWEPFGAENQGFDLVMPGGSYPGPPSYFAPYRMAGFKDGPAGEHIDERLTTEAIRFLDQSRNGPFFLNFWMFSVHAPFQGKSDLIEIYKGRADPRRPQQCPTMGAMIRTMDDCVGRLLDALDERGLTDNTLLIFVSDNGGNMYDRVEGVTPTSNHPLRGGKATIYEGGTRVPMVVSWPGKVRPGSRSGALASTIDLYPTILSALGIDARPGQRFDGRDLLPVLTGRGAKVRDELYCLFPHYVPATGNVPSVWVRQGDWKLIRFFADGPDRRDRFELYNLRRDVGERRDLADAMPAKVREMDALISAHLAAADALVPFANPAYREPVAGWLGNAQADLSASGGLMRLVSSGGDPFMTTEDVPEASGPIVFEWRMRSDSSGHAQVFWVTRAHPAYFRDRSVIVHILHDREWHEYRAELAVGAELTGLRLDPSAGPGTIEIEWIRALSPQGTVLKEYRAGR